MKSPRYLVPDGTYIADPAAHVFNSRLYIYPSHDIESGITENDDGDHFDMRDYHALSMDSIDGKVTDRHGVILDLKKPLPGPGASFGIPTARTKMGNTTSTFR